MFMLSQFTTSSLLVNKFSLTLNESMPKLKFNCQGKSRYWSFYGRLGKL